MGRPSRLSPPIDWPAIYADWLTGDYTNAALARKFGITRAAIGQRVKNEGWSTTSGPVPKPVLNDITEPAIRSEPKVKPDKVKAPKVDELLKQSKDIVQRLIEEVDNITTYHREISEIIIAEESDAMRRRAALKAISVSERTKTMKDLVATLRMIEAPAGAKLVGRPKKETTSDEADQPQGKKAQRQAEAEKSAASGVFAVPQPPRLVASK